MINQPLHQTAAPVSLQHSPEWQWHHYYSAVPLLVGTDWAVYLLSSHWHWQLSPLPVRGRLQHGAHSDMSPSASCYKCDNMSDCEFNWVQVKIKTKDRFNIQNYSLDLQIQKTIYKNGVC